MIREAVIRVKKLTDTATLPTKAHDTDLGYDLYCDGDTRLYPNGVVTKIPTGIAIELPFGYGALIRDRSSVATKQELIVVAGVIDGDYRGEVIVAMNNPGVHSATFNHGDKIAQLILIPTTNFPIVETDR